MDATKATIKNMGKKSLAKLPRINSFLVVLYVSPQTPRLKIVARGGGGGMSRGNSYATDYACVRVCAVVINWWHPVSTDIDSERKRLIRFLGMFVREFRLIVGIGLSSP